MADRNRPHLFVDGRVTAEEYSRRGGGGGEALPVPTDRAGRARRLLALRARRSTGPDHPHLPPTVRTRPQPDRTRLERRQKHISNLQRNIPEETFSAFMSYVTGRDFDYDFEHLPIINQPIGFV